MPINAAVVLFCPFRANVPYTPATQGVALGYYVRCAFSAQERGPPLELKPMPRGDTSQIGQIPTALT